MIQFCVPSAAGRSRPRTVLCAVILLMLGFPVPCRPEEPAGQSGQMDLDAALEAKLTARSLDDMENVLDLCRRAAAKGLSPESKRFADDLYTGTLIDRAGMLVDAILGPPSPEPQWPRMRSFAVRDLNEALQRNPELGTAHLMMARLQALPGGNRDRAVQAADQALRLIQDDPLQRAQAHLVRGNLGDDPAKRLEDYDAAVKLAPRNEEVRRTRGLFHLLAERFDQARADLLIAAEEEPEDVSLLEAIGMSYLMENKLDEAQKAFDKAIEIDPEAAGPLLQRARVQALKGEQPAAIADLDKAIQRAPRAVVPLVLRARILQQSGDTDRALQDLETVLRAEPGNPAALELRGLIAADAGDYAAAIRDFRAIAALQHEKDAILIGQLGMLHLAAKQPREAIRLFSESLAVDEGLFSSLRGRSDALISIGRHAEAIVDLEKALQLKPDDSGVLNNLAWLLGTSPEASIRDGKRAIELATKACELTEWKQPHIISTLAAGYAEIGDFPTAQKYSRQAVDAENAGDEVKQQLEKELESYRQQKPWREKQSQEETPFGLPAGEMPAAAAARPAGEGEPPMVAPRRPFD